MMQLAATARVSMTTLSKYEAGITPQCGRTDPLDRVLDALDQFEEAAA
jgi:hypothetical protein